MQIKVKDTRMHKIYDGSIPPSFGSPSFREVSVAEAKLVLVGCEPKESLVFKPNGNKFGTGLCFSNGKASNAGIYYKPILISETEKIEEGDWYYESTEHLPTLIRQCKVRDNSEYPLDGHKDYNAGFNTIYGSYKILALPEHFSPKHPQAIVDGKLKEGKVLVECESKLIEPHKDEYGDIRYNKHQNIIKLNSSNHITLHKVEERTYTKEEVNKLFYRFFEASGFDYLDEFENWFEQNVK